MKVMCIHDFGELTDSGATGKSPKYGEVVTVIDSIKRYNRLYYQLSEYPVNDLGQPLAHESMYFVHLSEIDEMELSLSREEVNA